jgi:hypothetical protein
MTAQSLILGTSTIRQLDGLYSLNDLHAASGCDSKNQPARFLGNKQTKDLVAEISNTEISVIKSQRGANGGTYACRELVIAYAAWISPAFHLKVIRGFLAHTAYHNMPDAQTGRYFATPFIPVMHLICMLAGTINEAIEKKRDLQKLRFFIEYDDAQTPVIKEVPPDVWVGTKKEIIAKIVHPDCAVPLTTSDLYTLSSLCALRLAAKAGDKFGLGKYSNERGAG